MCMVYDSEPWEFFTEAFRKAIKEHKCIECNRTILPGEKYRDCKGKVEGWSKIHSLKQCEHCCIASSWLLIVCDGYVFNAVEEDLFNHITGEEFELRSAALVRLGRWMSDDWRDRQGNLRPVEAVSEVTDRAIATYQKKFGKSLA